MGGKKIVSCFLLLILSLVIKSQVYNYNPTGYFNIETTPTLLTSYKADKRIKIIHKNSFSSEHPFSYSSVRFSQKLNSDFWGIGLTINNTSMLSKATYNHVGLGIGYRNVLFNKLYLKLGTTYKLIQTESTGSFDYYSYDTSNSKDYTGLNDKLNLAFSLTGESEFYYLLFSALNLDLPWSRSEEVGQFPKYYLLNVGNLISFFGRRDREEISYSGMIKLNNEKEKWITSHYLNLKKKLPLIGSFRRRFGAYYGAKIGYLERKYFHLIPFIAFYQRIWSADVLYNFHLDKSQLNVTNYSTVQFTLTIRL